MCTIDRREVRTDPRDTQNEQSCGDRVARVACDTDAVEAAEVTAVRVDHAASKQRPHCAC